MMKKNLIALGKWLKLVDTYESCIGIRLWCTSTRFAQLWYCPAGYEIVEHSHPKENIELMYLYGCATFFRRQYVSQQPESYTPTMFKHAGKCFTVSAGWYHWFTVSKRPLIFINFSTFLYGQKPESAAIDFQSVTSTK